MDRYYNYELVIESLPKYIMYEGKLPIRLYISNMKMPSTGIDGYGFYERHPCEITIYDNCDEWTDAIKKWYFYIFNCAHSLNATSIQKVDGKVYEYDRDGNITVSFNVYDIFPIMFNNECYYKGNNFTVTFSVDRLGSLEKAQGYKKESLFIENKAPTISEALNSSHLSWDEYFANIALLAALRSKDKNTKVGCVIVSKDHKILGTGYNGLPTGIDESVFPTTNDKVHNSYDKTKYAYVTHAELNAILNTSIYDISGSRLYCTLFPCCECAKSILQKGIKEVIYLSDVHHDEPEYIASRKLFEVAGVITRQYSGRILFG